MFFPYTEFPGDHVFDLCYSVSAVHYLAADSLTQTAERRIGHLTRSVKRILTPKGRPCTLQAYMKLGSEMVGKKFDMYVYIYI